MEVKARLSPHSRSSERRVLEGAVLLTTASPESPLARPLCWPCTSLLVRTPCHPQEARRVQVLT